MTLQLWLLAFIIHCYQHAIYKHECRLVKWLFSKVHALKGKTQPSLLHICFSLLYLFLRYWKISAGFQKTKIRGNLWYLRSNMFRSRFQKYVGVLCISVCSTFLVPEIISNKSKTNPTKLSCLNLYCVSRIKFN